MSYSSTKNKNTQNPQISLFSPKGPLAHRIRPEGLDELIGHEQIKGAVLSKWFENKLPYSIILWGPPGSGKTTIAFIAKQYTDKEFFYISGASTSISELREIINNPSSKQGRSILFIDEIHRLAKNQQDVLLEPLENGSITLIGTTTENPLVSVTRALHSRVKTIELKPLNEKSLVGVIERAVEKEYEGIDIEAEGMELLARSSAGDVRKLLTYVEEICELAKNNSENQITKEFVVKLLEDSQRQIGADTDSYYNYVSALQKSIRGSDPDAAVYWLARLLAGGADPIQVARRIMVCASEDIGLADPNGLSIAVSTYEAASFLGMPEARIPLSQAVIYLALAPKSNSSYLAINNAMADVREKTPFQVPMHLRNIGGEGYKYPHNYDDAKVDQEYLPKELVGKRYYKKNKRDQTEG